MEKINKLENKLADLLEKISREDHVQWLQHPVTKALLVQIEIEAQEIRDNWASGLYESDDKESQARGQAKYIDELEFIIRGMKSDD